MVTYWNVVAMAAFDLGFFRVTEMEQKEVQGQYRSGGVGYNRVFLDCQLKVKTDTACYHDKSRNTYQYKPCEASKFEEMVKGQRKRPDRISALPQPNTIFEKLFFKRYKLPSLFFSLHGLEHLDLTCCVIKLPLTFSGFIKLRSLDLRDVNITTKTLQRLLTNCPLLEKVVLRGYPNESTTRGNTFIELSECLPSIQVLEISRPYMKHFVAGGMQKLHNSLVHLRIFSLDACFLKEDDLSFALSVISSSPNLEKIKIQLCWNHKMCGRHTFKNLLDFEKDYPGLNLDHLKELEMTSFHDYAPEMAFVKLVMHKSPVLKKARIELNATVSVGEEVKMLRDLLRLPFPRASTAANVIIERRKY
ncbi:hypothetical protein L2E82_13934 [Cichorium intybus]|uniref:Uncharacterized protein n=1 Tax=Cichorium intybus TaxID=13427 RepID=A0ACB9EYX2_CICIN|nr:hypothetical protein L2E82_13934 [Cichorium intybus]